MFTDKELDELDARFKSAMEDKFDAYNEELNARQKEIERLRAAIEECAIADTAEAANRIAREALREVE